MAEKARQSIDYLRNQSAESSFLTFSWKRGTERSLSSSGFGIRSWFILHFPKAKGTPSFCLWKWIFPQTNGLSSIWNTISNPLPTLNVQISSLIHSYNQRFLPVRSSDCFNPNGKEDVVSLEVRKQIDMIWFHYYHIWTMSVKQGRARWKTTGIRGDES